MGNLMSTRGDCASDTIGLAGATGRVGAGTLTALVREGGRVIVLSRDESRAHSTIGAALDSGSRNRRSHFALILATLRR